MRERNTVHRRNNTVPSTGVLKKAYDKENGQIHIIIENK